jgi:hypothetical protein
MGDNTTPSNFKRRDVVFQPLAPMNGVYKAQKVSSSTSPKRDASSETSSDDFHTTYGDHDLNGMDRHMLGMLESPDISQAEANQHFNNYFK